MAHYFRDEIVAKAKALAQEGYSTRKAAAELGRLFPGEDTPSHPALVQWRKELTEPDRPKARIVSPDEIVTGGNGKGLIPRQAPHHTSDESKAQLVALHMQGHSIASASEQVGVSERTGWNWWRRFREVTVNKEAPEIMADWARIVRRSQGMMHSVLDQAEGLAGIAANDHPGPLAAIARMVAAKEIAKQAGTWNFYAGTGTDKLQKRDGDSAAQVNVQFNFYSDDDKPLPRM
ncbi:MAG: helix-turn-helix domain-containing protein [Chloroflexi bacterium]|nr:helix-turn-helix domain-containing protein [Chloroflexota bacterium]